MRNSWFALLLLLGATACESATEPPPDFPQLGEGALAQDAAHLALREMARSDSLALLPVTIDGALVVAFYDALLAVRAVVHPAADSVTRLYPIRTEGQSREFLIIADTAADHFDPWRNGQRITGVPALDSLTLRYRIELDSYRRLNAFGWDMFIFHAPVPLNLPALTRRYESAPGVLYAEPNYGTDSGADIRAERDGVAWLMTYEVAWGDCPSGCIHAHYWRFRVTDEGSVTYLGSGGEPAPSPEDWPALR